jgi:hypothetical protein
MGKDMRARLLYQSLLVVGILGLIAAAVAKAPPPSGTLTIATTSIAVGIGVNWGTGVLSTAYGRSKTLSAPMWR